MLQRLQSLYLLLAAICILMLYFVPMAKLKEVDNIYDFNTEGLQYPDGEKTKNLIDIPFNIIVPLIAGFSFLSIFLYKKRTAQLRLGRLNYLLHLTLIVLIFYCAEGAAGQMKNPDVVLIGYRGLYFPVAALAFLFLANRAIKKDEELVQSLNRLR